MIEKVVEGKAYIDGNIQECCIGIEGERIVSIKKIVDGEKKIRVKRGLILPSALDVHVHFREPGYEYKEDFSTGSISALHGGVTFIADMPNTNPPTLDLFSFKEKLAIAERKSYVDFSLYMGITNKNIENVEKLIEITKFFKIYLGESTGSLILDKENIRELKRVGKKCVFVFHAEDKDCLEKYKFNATNLKEHTKSRPSICEAKSINKILNELNKTDHHIHISHLSSIYGLKELENKPKNVSSGVTPHHLFFNLEQNLEPQSIYKVNPPIRSKIEQESLLEAFLNRDVDILESDHAPHTFEEKDVNFEDAPSGLPGVETMYPIMLYYFTTKEYPLGILIDAISKKPAEIFGLRKGRISEGMDADLAVFNLKDVKRIDNDTVHYKCGFTPFNGFKAVFPEKVFIRGELALDEGEVLIEKGFGKYVGDGFK